MKRKDRHPRLTPDGLPIDARDWTPADWQDLHEAMERVKRNVSKRHAEAVRRATRAAFEGEGGR